MEDREYYKKMIELFEEDVLVDLFEQGQIGHFDDIEYDWEETIEYIKNGDDMNTDKFNPKRVREIVELYRETHNRL